MTAAIAAVITGVPDQWLPAIAARPVDLELMRKEKRKNSVDADQFHQQMKKRDEGLANGNTG